MNEYEKYNKINENIDVFNLDNADKLHFQDMISRLNELKEKEISEELNLEEKGSKAAVIADLESFSNTIIQQKKTELESQIKTFLRNARETKNKMARVYESLVLENLYDLGLNEIIKGLGTELEELKKMAVSLIAVIDSFKATVKGYDIVELSINYNDIQNELNELKTRLLEIKKEQKNRYNNRVELVNKQINELKGLELDKLDSEICTRIESLVVLSTCEVEINEYKNLKYIEGLDYNNLVKMIREIDGIKKTLGLEVSQKTDELDALIEAIEKDVEIMETTNYDSEQKANEDIARVSKNVVNFGLKLESVRDKIGDKYEEYFARIESIQDRLYELSVKNKKTVEETNEYKDYSNKLNLLEVEVNSLHSQVETFYGTLSTTQLNFFKNTYNTLNGRINDIEKDVEKAYEENKLQKNQYEQLKEKIEKTKKIIEKVNEKILDPNMVKEVDKFSILGADINGIETKITALEDEINKLEKPIRDRKVRKELDKKFEEIEKEIKIIENYMEKCKEQNPEKYNDGKKRLDELKEKFNKLSTVYRKKCPFLVKSARSAKNFYKKHKKLCLVVAGLAAVALVHATTGPILIPAIMHGNLMVGSMAPALSGFTTFVNNILGGMIGAYQTVPGMWYLANGVNITASTAGTSLLKGLAISGLGSAALLAPVTAGVVVGVKKLMAKIKNKEKTKTKEKPKKEENIFSRTKKKTKEGSKRIKEKLNNIKKTKNNPNKETYKELVEILKDFEKSGMSLEEYCEEHELSEEQKGVLSYFIEQAIEREKKGRAR